jgi:predicted MPP superfamily phosphohydrolase
LLIRPAARLIPPPAVCGRRPITRRGFFKRAALLTAGTAGLGTGYGFWEASSVRVTRTAVPVPGLPPGFAGKTVAVLADLHHGPFVGLDFIRAVVRLTNALAPDLVALVGDYAHRGEQVETQLRPCLEALAGLHAPLGVFAVPGNHDIGRSGAFYSEVIAATPLTDLTNRHERVTAGGDHLFLAGVDDLWWGKPDLRRALDGVPTGAAVVLLSHNPDYAEDKPDRRVGLVLSGHTHGGQVYVPRLTDRWLPSRYGAKYRRGLVRGPASWVYVSRGLGESSVPIRMNCPPEVCLLTLTPGEGA